jgi:hypothetical protein
VHLLLVGEALVLVVELLLELLLAPLLLALQEHAGARLGLPLPVKLLVPSPLLLIQPLRTELQR